MQVSARLHALEIPFTVPVAPGKELARVAYVYLAWGEELTLIDCGVNGSEKIIFDYLAGRGAAPAAITTLLLTHSHPDHLGGAKALVEATKCQVWALHHEQSWIEDTARQFRERPVPGFQDLVGGSVRLTRVLAPGKWLELGPELRCQVLHTPGHSRGSTSFWFPGEGTLLTGDALPVPGDLPIYEDLAAVVKSIAKLQNIAGVTTLLSSWEPPIHGAGAISARLGASLDWLARIDEVVLAVGLGRDLDPMVLCAQVVARLGLPPTAVMPLVAKAFSSSLLPGAKG